jgi:hypothetical protein
VAFTPDTVADEIDGTAPLYRHHALFWSGTAGFLAATVPFITDGLALGEPVLVATAGSHNEQLRRTLGCAADRVQFVDMDRVGRNPARIIPVWQALLNRHHGTPVRGIGEPVWPGRRPEEVVECQLHEALLDVAIPPPAPLWLLCPYDVVNLDRAVIAEACRSHARLTEGTSSWPSESYGGRRHAEALFAADLPDLGPPTQQMFFNDADVRHVLAFVTDCAESGRLPHDRAADLAVAVQQLVVSSLQRGALAGVIRCWLRADAFVCEVHDHSIVHDCLTGRRLPGLAERKGVWFANQVCDLVQLRSTSAGTTARVHHWLG